MQPREHDWAGVHTCHAECPCQAGGQPARDFIGITRSATVTPDRRTQDEIDAAILDALGKLRRGEI